MLATMSVRIDPEAERVAIAGALETGGRLVVANMRPLPPYPITLMLAPQHATLPDEEDLDEVRRTAARAVALGIPTELLRVSSPRPVRALVELVAERRAALLVFGPDHRLTSRRRLQRAARVLRRDCSCLLWIVGDEPA
jgi:hypothetical protein